MHKIADASALGYAAFAVTLWMTGMLAAGWFDTSHATLVPLLCAVLGGCVMAVAGIIQSVRGHVTDSFLFIAFAGFWWVSAVAAHAAALAHPTLPGFQGWYAMVWAFVAFCVWLAARKHDVARGLFALGLALSLFAHALSHWLELDALAVLGGYLALVTAIIGIYIVAAMLLNETCGHTVLPLGENGPEQGASSSS